MFWTYSWQQCYKNLEHASRFQHPFSLQSSQIFLDNIALYRHWPPVMFKFAIAVVLSGFILICLKPFQDLQCLFKVKETAFRSKKLMWLCSFASHLSPIEKHPSLAPQPNSLASVYILKSILDRWVCLQTLGICWSC